MRRAILCNGSGTCLAGAVLGSCFDLDAAMQSGATIERSFPVADGVLLILRCDVSPNDNVDRVAADQPTIFEDGNRDSGPTFGSAAFVFHW